MGRPPGAALLAYRTELGVTRLFDLDPEIDAREQPVALAAALEAL